MNLKEISKELNKMPKIMSRELNPTYDLIKFVDNQDNFYSFLTSMTRTALRGGIVGGLAGYLIGGAISNFSDEEITLSTINAGIELGATFSIFLNSIRALGLHSMKRRDIFSYETHRRDLFVFLNKQYN